MEKNTRKKPIFFIETFILTSVLWFGLSGIFQPKFIAFGLISCAIISYICMRGLTVAGINSKREYYLLHFNYFKMLAYLLWLMKEVIKAALYVSKLITFKQNDFDQAVVWFKADYDNPLARVLLANSITVTPGTVTVDIYENGIFSVHAISEELREGILDGGMQMKVAKVFGEEIDFKPIDTREIEKLELPKKWRRSGNLRDRRVK